MAELTESERESVATLLAEQRHGIEWRWVAERTRQKYRDMADAMFTSPAVEQILAAREAALLDRLTSEPVRFLAAGTICKNKGCFNYDAAVPDGCSWCQEDADRALAAVRAELLRQGGEE